MALKHRMDFLAYWRASEGLWQAFSREIEKFKDEEKPAVFDCVNILPHIAKQYLDFPGIRCSSVSRNTCTNRRYLAEDGVYEPSKNPLF